MPVYRVQTMHQIIEEYEVEAQSPEDAELMVWGDLPRQKIFKLISDKEEFKGVGVSQPVIAELGIFSDCYLKEDKTVYSPQKLDEKKKFYAKHRLESTLPINASSGNKTKI